MAPSKKTKVIEHFSKRFYFREQQRLVLVKYKFLSRDGHITCAVIRITRLINIPRVQKQRSLEKHLLATCIDGALIRTAQTHCHNADKLGGCIW